MDQEEILLGQAATLPHGYGVIVGLTASWEEQGHASQCQIRQSLGLDKVQLEKKLTSLQLKSQDNFFWQTVRGCDGGFGDNAILAIYCAAVLIPKGVELDKNIEAMKKETNKNLTDIKRLIKELVEITEKKKKFPDYYTCTATGGVRIDWEKRQKTGCM